MATVIIESKKICDMCGMEREFFIDGSGESFSVSFGFVQTQGDRWEKSITAKMSASIPYHPCDDICTHCVKDALEKMLQDIESK